jgi:hypothetical protein
VSSDARKKLRSPLAKELRAATDELAAWRKSREINDVTKNLAERREAREDAWGITLKGKLVVP